MAAAVALLTAGLVGVPAYVSSTGSAALAIQLDESCVNDLGVVYVVDDDATLRRLESYLPELQSVAEPEISRVATFSYTPEGGHNAIPVTTRMYARPGQFEQFSPVVQTPGRGEVLVPDWATVDGALAPGTLIDVIPFDLSINRTVDSAPVTLTVAGTYPSIPSRPEPAFWCSYRDRIRPSAFGDRPPPMMLASESTFEMLPRSSWEELWKVSPDPRGLRRDEGAALTTMLESVNQREYAAHGLGDTLVEPVGLDVPVRRSGQVAEFVALTIAPLRYATVAAALALLCGAGVLAARAQRRELRLRALRGVGPVGLAGSQLPWLVPTTLAGAVVGGLGGWAAVRVGGPSTGIEPDAIIAGAISGALGWIAATVVVAGVIGVAGAATVDLRRRSPVNPRLLGEVAVVALAVWALTRLDRFGGVRQSGVQVRGGDLLAQAFPLLGTLAVVGVSARPAAWLLRRGRRVGRRLPPAALLGWRRVTFEPHVSAAVMLTAALSVAIAFQASLLTSSVDRLLSDKAEMLVGADLAISVFGSPPDIDRLGAASTEVIIAKNDERSIRLLGVDPTTFATVAYWRDDASSVTLDEAVSKLNATDRAVTAILVDPAGTLEDPPTTLRFDGVDRELSIVADAAFFPGYENGAPMLVVPSSVVDGRGDREIWVRDPIPGAAEKLQASGGRVARTHAPEDVFGSTSFLSARWAYQTLTAFSIVLGVVTLIAQLLVLEARERSRRVARVLTRPMGLTRGGEVSAVAIEVGVPLGIGGVIGAITGWCISGLALGRLDSLRNLQPPAVLATDFTTLFVAAGSIVLATLALAAFGAVRSTRADVGEVMRVAES